MRAAALVGTRQAERRVLRLTNPNLPGAVSNTLVANIQIVMRGVSTDIRNWTLFDIRNWTGFGLVALRFG
jgi:gentisate 1,2-dioxygenase